MEEYIYVLAKDGTPVAPTKRMGHIQKLLKKGMARVVSRNPFVVQMKYNVGREVPHMKGGTDPGRTNIGNAVMTENGTVVYKDHVETDNKDVPKHMADRKANRQASRSGERQARKRLARKNGTTTSFPEGRLLPGCNEPVMLKDIINTEARFNNRKRPCGWVTPTVHNLVRTHLNMVRRICAILPVSEWTIEVNRFAFMAMEGGKIYGSDYQNGRMKGFDSPEDYIFSLQEGRCACCGGKIEHYHHITPRSQGGSNLPENLVGLCGSCHERVHTGEISLSLVGEKKRYAALSVLNQAIPYIYRGLVEMFGEENVHICSGTDTKETRDRLRLRKDHPEDAVCIAAGKSACSITGAVNTYEVKQFRRHNRAKINNQRERTYYLDGRAVAKNRKPRYEQKGKALSDLALPRQDISRLTVKKSKRYYNTPGRLMPGTEFLYEGQRFILTGQLTGGKYFRAHGQGKRNFPAAECKVTKLNKGLVYV